MVFSHYAIHVSSWVLQLFIMGLLHVTMYQCNVSLFNEVAIHPGQPIVSLDQLISYVVK